MLRHQACCICCAGSDAAVWKVRHLASLRTYYRKVLQSFGRGLDLCRFAEGLSSAPESTVINTNVYTDVAVLNRSLNLQRPVLCIVRNLCSRITADICSPM